MSFIFTFEAFKNTTFGFPWLCIYLCLFIFSDIHVCKHHIFHHLTFHQNRVAVRNMIATALPLSFGSVLEYGEVIKIVEAIQFNSTKSFP